MLADEIMMPKAISEYAESMTESEQPLLASISQYTRAEESIPNMLSGHVQGRFLKLLAQLTKAKTIIELGTFTGYSALCLAEALPADGKLLTVDNDPKHIATAQRFFDKSPHGHKIQLIQQDALWVIQHFVGTFDLLFMDADKKQYPAYYEAVIPKMRQGGLIIVDNALWGGEVLEADNHDPDTQGIHSLNQILHNDRRVENVLLPLRDGMHLAVVK